MYIYIFTRYFPILLIQNSFCVIGIKSIDAGVTGHIDILQVRNKLIYILGFNPDIAKDKEAAEQLYQYATAFSFRTRLPLDPMRCT